MEAIIGAAFYNGSIDTVLKVMKMLRFNIPEIERYSDFWRVYAPHMPSVGATHHLKSHTIKAIEAITGYNFPIPSILAEALVSASLR